MIFISKDFLKTFTIKINGKRRRTSTNYVHAYIHTDRQTDIHTYITLLTLIRLIYTISVNESKDIPR